MASVLDDVASIASSAAGATPVGGIVGAVAQIGNSLIDRLLPDPTQAAQAKMALAKMQEDGTLARLTMSTDLAKAQAAIDQAEASSGNQYAADARPTVMYVLAAIMAWQLALMPSIGWACNLFLGHPVLLPSLDFSAVSDLLVGMLGLGGMRTYENVQTAKAAS